MWNKSTRFCLRAVLTYVVLSVLVTYTNIFFRGIDPGNLFNLLIISAFLFYRFLCILVVPVVLLNQFWQYYEQRSVKG